MDWPSSPSWSMSQIIPIHFSTGCWTERQPPESPSNMRPISCTTWALRSCTQKILGSWLTKVLWQCLHAMKQSPGLSSIDRWISHPCRCTPYAFWAKASPRRSSIVWATTSGPFSHFFTEGCVGTLTSAKQEENVKESTSNFTLTFRHLRRRPPKETRRFLTFVPHNYHLSFVPKPDISLSLRIDRIVSSSMYFVKIHTLQWDFQYGVHQTSIWFQGLGYSLH